jgi:hypothetical protein
MPTQSSDEQPTGVVGDASASAGQSRSGEDVRRRGWFWHWNSIVTQFAPIIGLKGVGLINSYTVWTDRREHSPHRGYAFPSQQSEADFYGEDRNELITINKLLVALDLIEIRKEMVPRTDAQGRRWKVPHNLYRVKDHGDDFNLTTDDVRRVVALADKDRAVYRYVRRIFSPKFAPIDRDNVWHQILEELRPDPTWQKLAARTERDERRASERTKAGHASRKAATNEDSGAFSLPNSGDIAAFEATARNSSNDSVTDDTKDSGESMETIAANINSGSGVDVAKSNNGLARIHESDDAPVNNGGETIVAPTSTTYYQELTTTTTGKITNDRGPGPVPDDQRDRDLTIQLFDEANDRVSTVAARRQLAKIAESVSPLADVAGVSGWTLVGSAIEEAVSSGSAFVAPKRIREILTRWERDGVPDSYACQAKAHAGSSQLVTNQPSTQPQAVTRGERVSHRSVRAGGDAAMLPIDRDPADVWNATCDLLQGSLSVVAIDQLRSGVRISGYEAGTVVLSPITQELADAIADGWGEVVQRKLGVVLRRPVRIRVLSPDGPDDDDRASQLVADVQPASKPRATARRSPARPAPQAVPVFRLAECRMTSTQVWMSVLDDLRGSGAIPKPEIDSWLRDSVLLGRDEGDDALIVGVPHALAERRAARFLSAIETATMHIVGFDCEIRIVRTNEWLADQHATGTDG